MNSRCTPDSAHRLVRDGHRAALLLASAAEEVIAAASALDPREPDRQPEVLEHLEASLSLLQESCHLTEQCLAALVRALSEPAQPGRPSTRGATRTGRYSAL